MKQSERNFNNCVCIFYLLHYAVKFDTLWGLLMKQPEYNILWILFQGILHCIGWNDFVQFHSRLYGSGTGISSENEVVKFWQSIFLYEFFGN